MSHDKIRAAARKRMAETGEPYATARRAVVSEHQAAGGQVPPPGAGYALRMSGEIHDWLADLRDSDPLAATRVRGALIALMKEGAGLGDPLVASTAESWPWVLSEALDRSYQERLDRLQVLRRGEADATALSRDIQDQIRELESARAELDDGYRRALDAGNPQEAAQAVTELAAIQQQAAEVRRLLPGVMDAGRRLAGGDGPRPEDTGGEIGAARARLADRTAQMERELGQEPWPEGLMALRPGALSSDDICILFAVEPPGAALLIAVLEGLEVAADRYGEAVLASADMLRRVRASEAPEASAHAYDGPEAFLAEFAPGGAGAASS